MKEQSGRSLIEMIGVLAIGAIMVSAVFAMYHSIDGRQKRLIASETLHDIVQKTQTLLKYSGYTPVSVNFLIESGAIKNDKAPMGSDGWSVTPSIDGSEFSINLVGLTFDECAYFTTKKFDWATHITVNGYEGGASSFCMKTGENKISFFAE